MNEESQDERLPVYRRPSDGMLFRLDITISTDSADPRSFWRVCCQGKMSGSWGLLGLEWMGTGLYETFQYDEQPEAQWFLDQYADRHGWELAPDERGYRKRSKESLQQEMVDCRKRREATVGEKG